MKKRTTPHKSYRIKALLSAAALMLCASAGSAQIYKAAPYCTVSVARPDLRNDVNSIKIGSLSYTASNRDSSYVYYNSTAAPALKKGTSYPVTINYRQEDMEPEVITIFIDYNHNNQFDASEKVLNFGPLTTLGTAITLTGNAVIPATALSGTTRMRVIYMEAPWQMAQPVADPCVNVDIYNLPVTGTSRSMYGGALDFNVNITGSSTAVGGLSGSNAGKAYPNPANDVLTISLTGASQQGTAVIYDVTGKTVKTAGFYDSGEIRLSVSDVPGGIYYLRVYSGNEVFTEKVTVAH